MRLGRLSREPPERRLGLVLGRNDGPHPRPQPLGFAVGVVLGVLVGLLAVMLLGLGA